MGMRHAVDTLMKSIGRVRPAATKDSPTEPVVFAVCNCYPTRILLYAAAFQGGWKVEFMDSLAQVLNAVRNRRPKAVTYDHAMGTRNWDRYCSALAADRVPFILLGHKSCDETFLVLLASGGYHAFGNPLTSEEIVKAVEFAEEVAGTSPAANLYHRH